MISLDTETTGLDFKHGARPFFVTTCTDDGTVRYWEWEVDPLTREPRVSKEDRDEVFRVITPTSGRKTPNPEIVGHNIKFDVHMLKTIGIDNWPWHRTHDTLIASHLLASNQPHNLTDLAVHYLGRIEMEALEKELEVVVQKARRYCRSHHKDWAIASAGRSDMPSAKEKTWKYDTWLPAALCRINEGEDGWETVLRDYANMDSAVTVLLWQVLKTELYTQGLWSIYLERMKLIPIVYDMEERGITLSPERLEELEKRFTVEALEAELTCTRIAAMRGYRLTLPRSGNNGSLDQFCFGKYATVDGKIDKRKRLPSTHCLNLPVYKASMKTGCPSLDKETLDTYCNRLPEGSDGLKFVRALVRKRKRDTARGFTDSYRKFWLPREDGGKRVYPSVNPTGTDTLRFSMSNPNGQQVSKQEDVNLRYCFGPAPGREWWCLDYENIELRIPAYESGEKELIELFERPDEPPYYGSVHLLNFHTVFPDIWEKELKEVGFERVGPHCKEKYKATNYQWVKNGGFCKQYGGQRAKTDATFRRAGAFDLIDSRLSKLANHNQACIVYANKYGYVETIPDREVDPERGYPLMCTRTEYGKVLPTVPMNYRTQGTAMQCTAKAMVRTDAQCRDWTKQREAAYNWLIRQVEGSTKYLESLGYYLLIQVHDELVFDFPRGDDYTTHLPKVRKLKRLMEMSGDDIGIPLQVAMSYHPETWAKGTAVK